MRHSLFSVAALSFLAAFLPHTAKGLTLQEAVRIAVASNPEIGQAIQNREAIEFELRQARGLYLPSFDLEASGGVRRLASPSRTGLGFSGTALTPAETSLVVTQTLYNNGRRRAEINLQASRVDGASSRVLERSSAIGLQVVQEYLEYLLQLKIRRAAANSLAFHKSILGQISESVAGGSRTEADRQQVVERMIAAQARLKEADEAAEVARIRFLRLVGEPLVNVSHPSSIAPFLPRTLDEAIGIAKTNNSLIKSAQADVDAAHARVKAANADRGPEIFLEGRGRVGFDVDGSDGESDDLQARVVARWNIFQGGIGRAEKQEQVRRASEQRFALHQAFREVEEAVRVSWNRRDKQRSLANILKRQAGENARLVDTYRRQFFTVGTRSLLDVLDAQNTRFNVQILSETASSAAQFSQYQLIAAMGRLLPSLGVEAPSASEDYARNEFNVSGTPQTETYARVPSRQQNKLPLDLLAPIRKK